MTQRIWKCAAAFAAACGLVAAAPASATPHLVVDAESGDVLSQEQATQTWFPASITKLMTVYVALKAVQAGRLTMDTPLTVSAKASRQAPSKMGFRPGIEVTLDNALKMLLVKSANDIAVTIAENIGGSVDGFADEMNRQSAGLGMRESHWTNPNGLPDTRQVTSARDMAVLARALLREFPSQRDLFGIGALSFGGRILQTHNGLLGRYPGADGMKTGFTCAAGFNVVASATRGGKRLITVVLGAPSARDRTARAAGLFDKGFAAWSGGQSINALASSGSGEAPNMKGVACTRHGRGGWASEFEDFEVPLSSSAQELVKNPQLEFLYEQAGTLRPSAAGGRAVASRGRPHFTPVEVYIGRAPGWSGPAIAVAPLKPEVVKEPVTAIVATPESDGATAYAPAAKPGKRGGKPAVDPAADAPMALSGAVAEPDEPKARPDDPKAARARAAKVKLVVKGARAPAGKQVAAAPDEPPAPAGKKTAKLKLKPRPGAANSGAE